MKKTFLLFLLYSISFLLIEGIARGVEWIFFKPTPKISKALPSKESRELRILLFGASLVKGEPIPEVGFAEQLRLQLEHRYPDRKIRLINFATSSEPSSVTLKVMSDVLSSDADGAIVFTANEFMRKASESDLLAAYAIQERLYPFAIVRLTKKIVDKIYYLRKKENLLAVGRPVYERGSAAFLAKEKNFQKNVDGMVRLAKEKGVPLFMLTAPSNELEWPPVNDALVPSFEAPTPGSYRALFLEVQNKVKNGDPVEAEKFLKPGLEIYPRDPSLHFLMGQIQWKMGHFQDAKRNFALAREGDPFPTRHLDSFNDYIRESLPELQVIDTQTLFESQSPHQVVGFNLMADNSHPNPMGNDLIARVLVARFEKLGLISQTQTAFLSLSEVLLKAGFTGNLKTKYFITNALTALRPPFFHLSIAHRYLEEARASDSKRWDIYANLATLSFFEKDIRKGTQEWHQARKLAGKSWNEELLLNQSPYLPIAARLAGIENVLE